MILVLLILFPFSYTHAYLDPGTGSYIIQVLIGLVFGAGYALKVYGHRIVKFFSNLFSKKKKSKSK
ncbi:hypothetical protein COT77_01270 [Candidatus Berkelbacteria bacterium CG10_big_fil_rev_8_21_14_0_10_41_12]|uniref:Uncharacterized protein n=1 Tax=Candidatus Berkelbacteria bacterium CG10_big_fil_rev_8_21_14_0_10_41_12 TaxID=1974513 RepID=A0A2M6WXF0_9BACT|nr:MAG: hypothetical protein COT77_01270 [Candidatus Berkelbacteria bacterium CG10_big_fil_rev_8_21_14_0_10_41_12]